MLGNVLTVLCCLTRAVVAPALLTVAVTVAVARLTDPRDGDGDGCEPAAPATAAVTA